MPRVIANDILQFIGGVETSGQDIQDFLRNRGQGMSAPAFYQMMAQLEDTGIVRGFYRDSDGPGTCKIRYFRAVTE